MNMNLGKISKKMTKVEIFDTFLKSTLNGLKCLISIKWKPLEVFSIN